MADTSSQLNKVAVANSLEWLRNQKEKSFDLFVLDPPYAIGYKYNLFKDNQPQDQYIAEQVEMLRLANHCLKDSGSIFYLNYPENAADIWARIDFMNRFEWINWVYNVHASGKPVRKASRAWLWLTKTDKPKIFNEAFQTEYRNPTDKRVQGMIAQGKKPQMFDWFLMEQVKNVSKEKRNHPCQLPEKMIMMLIQGTTEKDDLVGDCYSGCYDIETEVLTKEGWKFFKDISNTDLFLTRKDDGVLEYHKPSKIFKYFYNGEMIQIKGKHLDLLVTPNHNMYVMKRPHGKYGLNNPIFIRADDLKNIYHSVPRGGQFKNPDNHIPKEFMSLMGYYISEGYIQKERKKFSNNVIICQNPGKKFNKIWEDLKIFNPVKRSYRKIKIKLSNEQIKFIVENCGKYAKNKFISPYILNSDNLKYLFDAMMLGDGYISKKGNFGLEFNNYFTSSKRLADCFQELCLKIGYESAMYSRVRKPQLLKRDNRYIVGGKQYEISVHKSLIKSIYPKKHISKINYNNMVYCVEVPNHTLYVRRGGKTIWCGNSGTTGICASRMGRNFMGCDMDTQYVDMANEYIQTEMHNLLKNS